MSDTSWKSAIKADSARIALEAAARLAEFVVRKIEAGAQSPIEAKLLTALALRFGVTNPMHMHAIIAGLDGGETLESLTSTMDIEIYCARQKGNTVDFAVIAPQTIIGRYRVDILLLVFFIFDESDPPPSLGLVIECDGHDFHERTKEQARRDRERDRALQARGFKVLRFTGSEIHADADACAAEVRRIADDWCEGLCRARGVPLSDEEFEAMETAEA